MRVRRSILIAALVFTPVAARLALLPWAGTPLPRIHDEFCYLLAGDTFASGRLTNPTHPMWRHFETFHVIHQPTYNSKYPPGQGLWLAAGQRLAGQPWFGVVASYAAMLAAFCWAFHGWLPRRWALVACVIAIVRFPVYHYWLNSYWGGALAATGGALLVGAVGRMRSGLNRRAAAVAGLGLAVLAVSRPFEGLVLAVALTPPAAGALWKRRGQWAALIPGLIVVGGGLLWLGYYNRAVTGHSLKLPYFVHEEQYTREPSFFFQHAREGLTYRYEAMRSIHQQPIPLTPKKVFIQSLQILEVVRYSYRWEDFATVCFGFATLLMLPFALRRRSGRLPAVWLMLALPLLLLSRWYFEHYGAPMASLRLLVLVIGLRGAAAWLGWRWVRPFALRAGITVVALGIALYALFCIEGWRTVSGLPADRAAVIERLSHRNGKHLVIVRYAANHNAHYEWVFNGADIDGSRIVWARDMGEAANRPLVEYFKDRAIWLLEPDIAPREPRLYNLPVAVAR